MTRFSHTERVTVPLLAIGPAPLALEPLVSAVAAASGGERLGHDGAIVTFLGLVRNHNQGRRVQYLDYEAYPPLALKAFARIADEASRRWPTVRIALHHRTGRLEIGEASVAIVAASPHRGDAYAASRYVIERVKQIAPIWKREYFDGGDVWIEGATADPDDVRAREEAERVACA
jgi:molybdopterin synthase catalytic subunit